MSYLNGAGDIFTGKTDVRGAVFNAIVQQTGFCICSLPGTALEEKNHHPGYERAWGKLKLKFQEGERLFWAHSHCDIMKGGTQGFPRHEVSDKQEVLFEDVSPSTAYSIRQLKASWAWTSLAKEVESNTQTQKLSWSSWRALLGYIQILRCVCSWLWMCEIGVSLKQTTGARLFQAWDAISFTTMAAGPVSIHFVCGETRRPAGNCFTTPVLVGRDATAAIVVNEMRETAVRW